MIYQEINLKKDWYNHPKEIEYTIDSNSCWICTSHIGDKDGYPKIKRNGKHLRMSRYIYECEHGSIDSTLLILHSCDNPKCINPSHLSLGTHKDNHTDRERKGRSNKFRDNKGRYKSIPT